MARESAYDSSEWVHFNIPRLKVTTMLNHYLRFGVEAAGLTWDKKNDEDVDTIVTMLLDTAGDEILNEIARRQQGAL